MRRTLSFIFVASIVVTFSIENHISTLHEFRIEELNNIALKKQFELESHKDTVEIIFTGDVMQHMPQIKAARTKDDRYDFSEQFKYVRPIFKAADLVVVNFETTLSNSSYSGYPLFRSPKSLSHTLADSGVDIAVMANNHCCDGESIGIKTTIETLTKDGIEHTGVFLNNDDKEKNNPLRITIEGISLAIFNYTYGTNGMPIPKGRIVNVIDTIQLKRDLQLISRDSIDCIITVMHWGYEYNRKESAEQRKIAKFLKENGVDVVIGHHPHVVQPIDQTDSNFIVAYSLGNFVSNQRKQYTDGGIMARLTLVKSYDKSIKQSIKAIPTWVSLPNYHIIPPCVGDTLTMTPYERKRYDEFLLEIDHLLGHSTIDNDILTIDKVVSGISQE